MSWEMKKFQMSGYGHWTGEILKYFFEAVLPDRQDMLTAAGRTNLPKIQNSIVQLKFKRT